VICPEYVWQNIGKNYGFDAMYSVRQLTTFYGYIATFSGYTATFGAELATFGGYVADLVDR
jgi:hypothetical protein